MISLNTGRVLKRAR